MQNSIQYDERFRQFLNQYEKYEKQILKPTYNEIRNYLGHLENPEYWAKYSSGGVAANPSPVRTTFIRIKRPEKVVDKILRRPDQFPDGLSLSSLRQMHDTIGVRVVVFFQSQLPLVDLDLRTSQPKVVEISEDDPPEAYLSRSLMRRLGLNHIPRKEKENGYSSIHYTVRLARSSVPKEDRPFFEVQIRTLAMELWSELEHNLAYKPETRKNFFTTRRFEILSKELEAVDENFNLLYKELVSNQETTEYEKNDILTPENLPAVLKEICVQCSFNDLRDMLKLLSSRGINTVGELLELATPRRLETIRNTYLSSTGQSPSNFEIIATLGALKGSKNSSSDLRRINAHIEYDRSWEALQKELQPA